MYRVLLVTVTTLVISSDAKKFRSLSCPKYCSPDIAPVCGDDGVIYKNDCQRRRINCGDDSDKVSHGHLELQGAGLKKIV